MAAMRIAAIPPMTPPAIAPVFGEELLDSGDASDDEVGLLGAIDEAAAKNNRKTLFSPARKILGYQWPELTLPCGNDSQQAGSPRRRSRIGTAITKCPGCVVSNGARRTAEVTVVVI